MNHTTVALKLNRRKLVLLYLVIVTDKGGLVRGIVTKPAKKDDYPEDAWDYLGDLVRQQVLVKVGQEKGEDVYQVNKNPPAADDGDGAGEDTNAAGYRPALDALADAATK